jgi:2-amino-4-hydroxy-6-hydroxymethyldihydropteridine diphosphokinase
VSRIAFGLGGNVGEVQRTLQLAVKALCDLPYADAQSLKLSGYYHSEALLDADAPAEWNMPFVNQVITLECAITDMEALLRDIKCIETQLGRQDRGHWGPRELDIDIIAIEHVRYHSDTLTIPHKEAHKRDFVLVPLREVWPECEVL